ncbi:MAG: DinB family protein [Candidatus Saccharibacteria bacterium]
MDNDKQTFLAHFDREFATTKNVIAAFSDAKLDFKPEGKLRTAKEILGIFPATEMSLPSFAQGKTPAEWTPYAAETVKDILSGFERGHKEALEAIKGTSAADLQEQMDFWGTPMRRIDALWVMLLDNIHHRGQMTVYLRAMGEVVPSVYGPTAEKSMGA